MTVKAIVTDIEGTTSSIDFVHNVLFPFARKHMRNFLRSNLQRPEVQAEIEAVRVEMNQPDAALEQVVSTLEQWMAEDRKATPLKALQGMLWKAGYERDEYVSHLYPDAVHGLRRWHAAGLTLAVFSSGSVAAQKLLFTHTEYGDMTPLFSHWFDTNIGNKREPGAYQHIASALQLPAAEILFLSDIEQELDAAADAGMQTAWLLRDQPIDTAAAGHPQYPDFDRILS